VNAPGLDRFVLRTSGSARERRVTRRAAAAPERAEDVDQPPRDAPPVAEAPLDEDADLRAPPFAAAALVALGGAAVRFVLVHGCAAVHYAHTGDILRAVRSAAAARRTTVWVGWATGASISRGWFDRCGLLRGEVAEPISLHRHYYRPKWAGPFARFSHSQTRDVNRERTTATRLCERIVSGGRVRARRDPHTADSGAV